MSTSPLWLVCLAPGPLGLYVRAGRVDQKDLQSFITSSAAAFAGVAFEAKRPNDLRITPGPYAKKRRDLSFARHPATRIARDG